MKNFISNSFGNTRIAGLVTQKIGAAPGLDKAFDAINKAVSSLKNLFSGAPGSLFNPGLTSDIVWRARYMLDHNFEPGPTYGDKTNGSSNRYNMNDFFINFIDDFNSPGFYRVPGTDFANFRPDYIFAAFTPAEWNSIIDKYKAVHNTTQYGGGFQDFNPNEGWVLPKNNLDKLRYENAVLPWLQQYKPQAYNDIMAKVNEYLNMGEGGSTGSGGGIEEPTNKAGLGTFATVGLAAALLLGLTSSPKTSNR